MKIGGMTYDDGSVYRFYGSALNQDQYLEEIKGHRASMELEFPLPEEDIRRCGTLAERHDIHFISPHIREVIDSFTAGTGDSDDAGYYGD